MRTVYMNPDIFQKDNAACGGRLPYDTDLSVLSELLTVHGKTIPNRLACQAMEGCDGRADGSPDELTTRRYLRFARGGAGIIWFEATACMEEARANPRQLWLHEGNLDSFRRLINQIREEAIRANGVAPLIIMQDTHSGRYAKPHGTPAPIIAYSNPLFEKDKPIDPSRIITDEGLDRVRDALIHSASLAERVGFDGVDIKCCHRYLNSELLSAYTRPGRYGGSYENRTRLLREAVAGAMQVCASDFMVSSRLNIYDGFQYPYGFGVAADGSADFDPTEPIRLVSDLRDCGVELLNLTMGNPYVNPHVNRPFVRGGYEPPEDPLSGVTRMLEGIRTVHEAVPQVRVICSGLSYLGLVAPQVAAGYIRQGGFDFAGFGRMAFADPDFANRILRDGALDSKKICLACSKCTELMRAGHTPGCVVRDPLYTDLYRQVFRNQPE